MSQPYTGDSQVGCGDELLLDVERVAPGGHCVARHEGRVVFVRHTLPGERVRARVTEVRRDYLRADAVAVLSAAPARVPAPCRFAGPGRCGGCDWQHVAPAVQRELKAATVVEMLTRVGKLPADEVAALDVTVRELPGGPLGWRTRVRYAVDRSGRIGLHRYRSHAVIPVRECLLATREVRTLPVIDRRWPRASAVTAAVSSTGDSAVSIQRGRSVSRLVSGSAELTERAAGHAFEVPADAFWQVHPAAPDTFVAAVLELLGPRPGERALDLYGGVGLFAAPLAERVGAGGAVTLVESDRAAVGAARANLAGVPAARVVAGRVEAVLPELLADRPVDVVVLDPPRSGAGAEVLAALAGARPRAICYVACDPASFARDVRTLAELGWRLDALRAYDAFPMTHHVECIGRFAAVA